MASCFHGNQSVNKLSEVMEDDELIGVYVRNIDLFEPDFFLCDPSIDCYLVEKNSGKCVKADSSPLNIYSYASPFVLSSVEIPNPRNWNRLLVIESKFSELNSDDKMLLFEISKKVRKKKSKEFERKRISWAFLMPRASDGSTNTNQHLKLQLFKVTKNCKISHQDCNMYHLYSDHKLKKIFGVLQVVVKGVVPKEKPAGKEEEEKPMIEEEKINVQIPSPVKSKTKSWQWSRHPNQSCKVPNAIHRTHVLGKNGVSCLQFSRSGTNIAVAVFSKIHVFSVITGEEISVLKSHIGFIYELDWSPDDEYILSVSSDCRGVVWCLPEVSPIYILPHPTYVYCGKWLGGSDQIVTGGKDHILRYWRRNGDSLDLVEEMPGHPGFISALATQDGNFVFSGDSQGFIIIKKLGNGVWKDLKQLSFGEIGPNVIDSIHVHYSKRRIVISVRSKGSFLIDVVSGIILQTYKSVINTFARCLSCLTPCGSYLFSFCQNGDVGVWEVNTGKLFATYENLFPIDRLAELSGCIHYHPHEHMVGIGALGSNHSVLLLKYDLSEINKVSLNFPNRKVGRNFPETVSSSKMPINVSVNNVT